MKLEQIDKNFVATSTLGLADLAYYDVRQAPFQLYGLYQPCEQPTFIRLDPDIAAQTNAGVKELNHHTAGGRVRFSTDSDYVALRCVTDGFSMMTHMPATGSRGFDLYEDMPNGKSVFRGVFRPSVDPDENGNASYETVVHLTDRRMRHFTVNFPLYHNVRSVAIGVRETALLGEGASYRAGKPVVFYGSSITQGGCASRPGTSYQAMISRELNCDYVNYGFSGSARGEEVLMHYLAAQPASVFVLDYDHNAPSAEHLEATHERAYRILRDANPDLPIIMVSRPGNYNSPTEELYRRREIVHQTFRNAWAAGDRNIAFIDGESLFAGLPRGECTVDGCHPTDLGFYGMARVIGEAVARFLARQNS